VSGLTPAAVKRLFKETGDPGDVAFMAKSNVGTLVAHPPLRCQAVYDTMLKMAACKGTGAVRARQLLVEKLLVAAKGEEARFLVRSLLCNLRVGAVRTSLLSALARAVALSPSASSPVPGPSSLFSSVPDLLLRVEPLPSGKNKKKNTDAARLELATVLQASEELIRRVYARHPNYNDLVAGLLEVGLDGLADSVTLSVGQSFVVHWSRLSSSFCLRTGIPLLPTLGSPTRSLDDIYDLTHGLPFTAEFKYDGQRAQIHAIRRDDAPPLVKLFSRHLEDMTDKASPFANFTFCLYLMCCTPSVSRRRQPCSPGFESR
jgi:DNA ligase-1